MTEFALGDGQLEQIREIDTRVPGGVAFAWDYDDDGTPEFTSVDPRTGVGSVFAEGDQLAVASELQFDALVGESIVSAFLDDLDGDGLMNVNFVDDAARSTVLLLANRTHAGDELSNAHSSSTASTYR